MAIDAFEVVLHQAEAHIDGSKHWTKRMTMKKLYIKWQGWLQAEYSE